MKNRLKRTLALLMTVLMIMSSWVFVVPASAEGPAYGMGRAPSPTTEIELRLSSHADDFIKLKYPAEIYMDIKENLSDTGYKILLSGAHCGGKGDTDYSITFLPPIWGGADSHTRNNNLNQAFNGYGVTAAHSKNDDGENGWNKRVTNGFTLRNEGFNNAGFDGYDKLVFNLKGTPKNTGDVYYSARNGGDNNLYFAANHEWLNWPSNRWREIGNTTLRNGQDLVITVHVYDKAGLDTVLKNTDTFLQNSYNAEFYVGSSWNAYSATVTPVYNASAETLRTREVSQQNINDAKDAIVNKVGSPQFKADNAALISAIAAAEAKMAEADYSTKYTSRTRAKLAKAFDEANTSSYKETVPTYTVNVADGTNLDAGKKAHDDKLIIEKLANDLMTAVNGLKVVGLEDYTFTLAPAVVNLLPNGTADIKAEVNIDGTPAESSEITWSVEPAGVVTVTNGRIQAVKNGNATVKAVLTAVDGVTLSTPIERTVAVSVTDKPVVNTDDRLNLNFNKNWKFHMGDVADAAKLQYSDASWEQVNLPHDFSIKQNFTTSGTEVESGNIPGGTGWYRKMFTVPASVAGKSIILNFDGSYNETEVYVNGTKVGVNKYGYNSFSFDITDKLHCDGTTANLIAVKVTHNIPSSRWYSGSGLFRDITFTVANPVHVALHGTKVTMPNLESSAGTDGKLSTEVTLQNDLNYAKDVKVKTVLYSPAGAIVSTGNETAVSLAAGETKTVTVENAYNNPQLWSNKTPNLYTLKTVISDANGNTLDTYPTVIGYRWFNWHKDNGFSLNGENMKIQGVCMHHDQGALGAVQEYDAIYRQMSILKDMGVNAVRTSHNATSRVLLDICNQLGLIVMEEFFDGWDGKKNYNDNDFHSLFNAPIGADTGAIGMTDTMKWYEFVVTETVKRDRNDPSIVIWSMGNELMEGVYGGGRITTSIATDMGNLIKSLDSRPITIGDNRSTNNNIQHDIKQYVDVVGGNYNLNKHWGNKENAGGKPFIGSETASAVNSRGVYNNPRGEELFGACYVDRNNKTINSFDNSWVGWGNSAAEAWNAAIRNDWFSGEFVWTGFDYIGEPTPWNNDKAGDLFPVSSYFGIIDTAGFGKDSYYLYRSFWNDDSKTLHLVPGTWNRNLLNVDYNGFTNVAVYSSADNIKLLLDGNVIATAKSQTVTTPAGHTYQTWTETVVDTNNCNANEFYTAGGNDLYPQFNVRHGGQTLSVQAFDADGNNITSECTGIKEVNNKTASKIVAKTWGEVQHTADGDSFIYVEFEAQDELGNFTPDYNEQIDITVTGEGIIKGVDNGHGGTTEKFQANGVLAADGKTAHIKMFNGRALAIVGTTENADDGIAVAATSRLPVQGTTFSSAEETPAEQIDEYEEVFPQQNVEYKPTTVDKFNEIKDKVNALTPAVSGDRYDRFLIGETKVTKVDNLTNGEYVIIGENGAGDKISSGAVTHNKSTNGDVSTDANMNPGKNSPKWKFEAVNGKADTYYIYHTDNGSKQYLCVSGDKMHIGSSPYEWTVTKDANGKFKIYNGKKGVNYSGNNNFRNTICVWEDPTPVDLYTVKTTDTIPDGNYIIYNKNDDVRKAIALNLSAQNVTMYNNDAQLSTDSSAEYNFRNAGNNQFIIKDSHGSYLRIGSGNGSLGKTVNESEATRFDVHAYPDGRIAIYKGNQLIDHYAGDGRFNSWSSTVEGATDNRKMTLYKPQGDPDRKALYDALKDGITYAPGEYSKASYDRLLDALNSGYDVYNNSSSSSDAIKAATKEIRDAIAGLEVGMKKFSSTLFKYGYDNTNGKNYNAGGKLINKIALDELKAEIKSNASLMDQIKTIAGYDTLTWASQYEKDKAVDDIVTAYAQIYLIQFTNDPVANSNTQVGMQLDVVNRPVETGPSVYLPTAWNLWCKTGTRDTSKGETGEEGASVQGLAGATIGKDNTLTSHAPYPDPLLYGNESERGKSHKTDKYYTEVQRNGITSRVDLEPLSGISPYFTDLFRKEVLLHDGSVTTSTTGEFAKYYWDTSFPFLMKTDPVTDVNTYKYDSSDTKYRMQASYNDAEHSADMNMKEVNGDWSVNRASKDPGKGFFPFNYQGDATALTGENAIYHYGMTFTTNFTIPSTGRYKGSAEDIVFNFSGDDDVYVYIDDVLVLDNGGLHGARSASINFTQKSVSYQYAMDVTEGTVKSQTPDNVTYTYGAKNEGISADNQAAINKLNDILTGGEEHTFTFFYLERGSTDSNCKIEFNLQESSSDIKLEGQSLVLDYGLPVEYDITSNNIISQAAIDNKATVEYLGIGKVNQSVNDAIGSTEPEMFKKFDASGKIVINKNSSLPSGITMRGEFTFNKDGTVKYVPDDMNFTRSDTIFVVAKVTNDPTFEKGTVYYQYERITFLPATTIYYEDNFKEGSVITYTDGKGSDIYGIWKTEGTAPTDFRQAADLVGEPGSNVYGHDPAYDAYNKLSGGSAHYVEVSKANNPRNKDKSVERSWPTAKFTFTGTGFDVISLTSNKTGAVEVKVTDMNGKKVADYLVDTYYGYNYGRLYMDSLGNPTHTAEGNTVMYKNDKGTCTVTPMYYDENGKLTQKKTDEIAYAYGWLKNSSTAENALYQIPVIKSQELDYGKYTVEIIPTFTSMFGHQSTDSEGNGYYGFYLDGLRIYNPVGIGTDGKYKDPASDAGYNRDQEKYPSFVEIKDLLIGVDSFGPDAGIMDAKQGVIFIDGIAQSINDIDKYKQAGPNNELYLAKDQAVAFEIWATAVPNDVQIGLKQASGIPAVTVTNGAYEANKTISSAAEMYYSFDSFLPEKGKLTWQTATGKDGKTYYKTQMLTVQNTSAEDSILSITNLKWTFTDPGNNGYIDTVPAAPEKMLMPMVTPKIARTAMTSVNMLKADLNIEKTAEPVVENGKAKITLTTSTEVTDLLIRDEQGRTVVPENIESIIKEIDGNQVKEWNVTIAAKEAGTFTYSILGVYENGYVDESKAMTVTVTFDKEEITPDEESFLEKLSRLFRRIKDFFYKLIHLFDGMKK